MIHFHRKKNPSRDPFVIQEGKLSYGNFNGKFRRDWVEQAFTPNERGEEVIRNQLNPTLVSIGKWVCALLLIILGCRSFWLQVVKGAYYKDMANGNRIRLERLDAGRGMMYDRNGVPLVQNVANFLLYCIPADLPKNETERSALIDRLAALSGKFSAEEIKNQLAELKPTQLEYYQPLFMADNIPYDAALKIYLESFHLPGIAISSASRRQYPLPSLSFSHLLGYTGKINETELASNDQYSPIDYVGKTGLEKSWENELRGVPGFKHIEVDALGKEKKIASETAAVPGNNLTLAIDAAAQKKLEEIIANELKISGRTRAAAIVMNPQNGEIVSLISLPAFDNNVFARGITTEEYSVLSNSPDHPLFNRVVSGEYPSGSTIKPVVAAAALDEHIISPNTTILSNGGLRVGQWSFPDWKAGGHGVTDVRKAIAESVNTFFYYIGGGYDNFQGLGIDKMVEYFKKFLLGTALGIDLPNEARGFVPTKEWKEATKKERWYIGDTYHVAIGQGDLIVTPLQIAAYTAFFANGGKMYEPHIVKEVKTPEGQIVKTVEPKVIAENIIQPVDIEVVREGMRQTVTEGSARSMSALPVSSAGKTGTAQWASNKPPHAWFTGFAPYENPELVITVLIEEGEEGSRVATPVAREFFQWYFGEYKKTNP